MTPPRGILAVAVLQLAALTKTVHSTDDVNVNEKVFRFIHTKLLPHSRHNRIISRAFSCLSTATFDNSPMCAHPHIPALKNIRHSSARMAPNEDFTKPWESNPILPRDVVPVHYDLFLDPHIEDGSFFGRVNITVNVTSPKDHIILHTKLLNITSTQLFNEEQAAVPVKDAFEYAPNEFWVVLLKDPVSVGTYSLRLDFNGSLTGSLVGFYRSSYTKKDGTQGHIATTKFEPTYARRAFPCFDEPSFKATYSTKLVRPAKGGYIALSNMNQIDEEEGYPESGKVTVRFAQTPAMSTYLACFIVCDFPHLPSVTVKSSGTPVSVYARPSQIENAQFALKTAVDVLDYFNNYFDMRYPLPKLDLIGIPDFVSGAMENWGLVTFRESRMLASPDASAPDLLTTSNVVAHELAHMWFGDIVTMAWWDDLWLNEGFATFLANSVLTKQLPDYPVQATFALGTLQTVLVDDAAISSHPIIRPLTKPDQITEAFDTISYNKGSSVLRMVEDFDPEGFRKAVIRYLEKHQYQNARTSDLWAELAVEYKAIKDAPRMLDTWTKQMGFPVINVKRNGSCLELRQSRCLSNINVEYDPFTSPYGYKWDVPVKYITSASKKTPKALVMKMEDDVVTETLPDGVSWFKLNPGQFGFYRVNYTEDEWENLRNVLTENQNDMTGVDRSNLIDDAFALAKAGYLNYKVPLRLIGYLKNGLEKEYAPWNTLSKYFTALSELLYSSEDADKDIKTYFGKLVAPSLSDELWNISRDQPPTERYLKSQLLSLACKVGNENCLKKANQLFNEWTTGGLKPPVDIRPTVFIHGIKGPELKKNWQELWNSYLEEEDAQEKEILQAALCSTTDSELILKLLEFAKNESYVRSQDYFTVLFSISRTPTGNEILWTWTKQNWEYMVDRFTLNHRQFGNLLPFISLHFYTEQRLTELQNFMAKYPEEGAGAVGRKKAVEIVKANIRLYSDYQPVIKKLLKELVA